MALGADIVTLRRMVLRQVGAVAITGMAIGLGIAIAMSSFVRSLLFQTSALDPPVVMLTCGALLQITLGTAVIALERTTQGDLSRGIRHL